MLRFLFNRESRFVMALEIIGLLGFLWLLFFGWFHKEKTVTQVFFAVYIICYLINRFISIYPWYGKGFNRDIGICLHFRKMYVAGAYFIAVTNIMLALGASGAVIYPAILLFVFALHIELILLYFHWKDNDVRPPNFLTSH